jgi:hypothetical protein
MQAFQLWEQGTNRNCHLVNDDITGSFECKWQDIATDELGYEHISIFCSLGEWANNISDILQNESYDYYDFLNDDCRIALFRYYTRLLLIVSEMLGDFEAIVQRLGFPRSKKAREYLSSGRDDVHLLLGFINKVCKHKVESLHQCNHHLPIWFEDCKQSRTFAKPISINSLDFDHPDGILISKLSFFVQVILNCYSRLDELFEKEPEKFKIICNEYNGISHEE